MARRLRSNTTSSRTARRARHRRASARTEARRRTARFVEAHHLRSLPDSRTFESRIRRHLVGEDIIGSTVEAAVAVSTPERKQVRVSVEAGHPGLQAPPCSTRAMRRSTAAIWTRVDRRAADRETTGGWSLGGWPRAIESYYRNQGFLEATSPPRSRRSMAAKAVLPVTIVEGRRFVLDAITFPGVHPDRQVDVAQSGRPDVRHALRHRRARRWRAGDPRLLRPARIQPRAGRARASAGRRGSGCRRRHHGDAKVRSRLCAK